MLKVLRSYTRAYLMRGEVSLQQKDTVAALKDFNTALELDKYDPDAWSARAIGPLAAVQLCRSGIGSGPCDSSEREERG